VMQAATAVVDRSPTAKPASPRGRTTQAVLSVLGPAILGFGCGISAFLKAYYDLDVWGWIGLGLLAVVIALVVGSGRPRGVAFPLALGGLVGLWLWSLLSTVWAESSDQALVIANRWLLYAAFFMVACYAARRRGGALGLLGGVAAGGLVTVLYLAVNLLGSAATGFFSGRRLYDPLEYVNGMGTYLLVGAFWPAVALAERARPIPLAALAAGVASLTADLMLLTQSRGVAAAAIASVIAVMAIVPGRVARGWLLFLIVVAFAAAAPALLAVYQDGTGSRLNPSTVHHAATIALVAAAGVAAAWGGVLLARRRLASRYPDRTLRAIAALALAGVLVAGLVVLAIFSGRIADDVSRQYDAFVHPGPSGGPQGSTTRLISGAGYRYDYWRIAWSDFTAHPLNGVGAGGYDVSYYRKRATTENIRQPHSVELQVLGETGIVGGLALLAFVTGVYLAVFQRRELARTDLVGRGMIVAALGGFTTWLVHTSVDWMSLMPGMTGMALCGAAVLTVYDGRPVVSRRISRSLVAVGVLVVLLGAVFLGRTTIAERLELDGQAELASNPTQALHDAQRSLAYNGASVPARYVESGAYERMGDYARSRGALLAALDQEPSDWVTWVLLGDSAVRSGDLETARADYRVAHGLNPLDPTVAEAARNPRSSLGPTR
jgi:hypothetical protein